MNLHKLENAMKNIIPYKFSVENEEGVITIWCDESNVSDIEQFRMIIESFVDQDVIIKAY